MKKLKRFIYTLLFTITIVTFPATLSAANLINHSSGVFKFQQKLAKNGNVEAQYKLAMLYETGAGVEPSFEKALHWYDRAAKAGLKKAEHRSTYLMVNELGFNSKMHSAWLEDVINESNNYKPDAMLLLGQLYRKGLAVKKNLNKSLDLLTQVSVLGDADLDDEIESIHAELAAAKNAKRVAKKPVPTKLAVVTPIVKTKVVTAKPAKVKSTVVKPVPVKKAVAKVVKPAQLKPTLAAAELAKKRSQAEKIRRYEKAMMKLKEEQRLIDELQADVTDGALASVDDEI